MHAGVHNVRIGGRQTSIWIEPNFWELFRLAAIERGATIGELLTEVERAWRLLPYQGPNRPRVLGLSAAVRMFVLQDIIWKLETARARHSGARPKRPRKRCAEGRPWLDRPVPRAGG